MNRFMNRKFRFISMAVVFFVAALILPAGALPQNESAYQSLYSYADNTADEFSGEEIVEVLADDPMFEDSEYDVDVIGDTVDLMQDVGIDILDCDVSDDGNIVLESEVNGHDSSIEITEATDESVIIKAEEGELSGTLEMKDDGTMWLDGKEINIIDEYDGPDNNVAANAKHIYKATSSCPYGKASDYTTKVGSYTRSAEFEKKASAIPRGILIIALGALLGPILGTSLAVGVAIGTGISIADLIISNAGTSKWISARVIKYAHKTKGTYITSHRRVWKETTPYNTGINMTGKTVKTTTH